MSAPENSPRWSLVIHGGAGVMERAAMSPELDARYRAALRQALSIGGDILDGGGSALDAVQATAMYLEDEELFNAGRGAVFTAEGRNELDAAIMDGRTRAAGAVAGLTRTKNPIAAARAVMERSRHVMLVGEGAEVFARAQGLEEVDPSYFFTEPRWRQLERALREQDLPIPPRPAGAPPAPQQQSELGPDDHRFGTIGVVAYDSEGNIAAGTSTGGVTAKRWGRVGDSPVIGAGTYAQNGVCGVSATGSGEYFIRVGVAREICLRMQLRGESAQSAANAVMADVDALGGEGGVIVLDAAGRHAYAMNSSGMFRAYLQGDGDPEIKIFADEE
ncbi:MAG: isoaspartyl peptidase/L-asparaginase [Hyphomonadaceae bacterium]|nr:isoaspartyl peptidase/L-asparaginase [Hyphomonadaceae bacterium]